MSEQDVLIVERDGGVATVTLNRPKAMNALSRALRAALASTFAALDADQSVRVVILTGAGRAFCAGLDLKELGQDAAPTGLADEIDRDNPADALGRCTKPIIGAINGFAITGGFELALACDILIASTEAQFADTHARVGIVPAWGLSQKLSRAIGIYRAKELSLTGNFIAADKAASWGLINRAVAPDALMPTCRKLAEDMLSLVPAFLPEYKKLINDGFAMNFGAAIEHERTISREANRNVTAADVEARREDVRKRGQSQSNA